jgi:hypothetical protein
MLFNNVAFTVLGGLATTSALAYPKNTFNIGSLTSRAAGSQAVDQILAIAPASKSCSATTKPDECATAEQAAPFLIKAFQDYQIYNSNEIAAVLSLIAFESVDFSFNTNQSPGRPGQGTRNMQMPEFNMLYARSISALAPKVDAITTAKTVEEFKAANLDNDKLNAIRALVLPNEYSFASAMWFLTTQPQCVAARPKIQAGGDAALDAYMACVGVTADADRKAKFALAKTALGL